MQKPDTVIPQYTRRMMKRLLLALFLACAMSAPAWAGLEEGFGAYKRGDFKTAYHDLRPLAEQGNAVAQSKLGFMYNTGQGVAQDYAEAVKWYRRAAKQGQAAAQSNLGVMFATGQGVAQNYAEAMNWFRLAADQGKDYAQSKLGYMYNNGNGVAQDYAEAVKWYRRAAEQGHAAAQFNLGIMYANGQGVAQNYMQAHVWYDLAASRLPPGENRNIAVRNRDRAEKRITPAQMAEAQRLARNWRRKHAQRPAWPNEAVQ